MYKLQDLKSNQDWTKFWAFRFSLLGASILCSYYPKKLKEQMGKGFSHIVIISKKGHSTCLLKSKEREEFGKHQIKVYIKNGGMSGFCKLMRKETDKIFSFIKEFKGKNKISKKDFEEFVDAMQYYLGIYTVPRQVIDFIDPGMVEKILNDLKEIRLYSEPVFGLVEEAIQTVSSQISSQSGYKSENISCMLLQELQQYLEIGKLPEEEILKKRYQRCGVYFNKDGYEYTTDSKTISKLENLHIKKTGVVSGVVAFKGKVRGIARIVDNPFKVNEFNKGDILLTGMTRPDFLPLMEKSSAIVTDIGGLLCHAAIVAREIGKPCIIGTQKATKTFKEGDRIEVDANKGIVRKLSSHKK